MKPLVIILLLVCTAASATINVDESQKPSGFINADRYEAKARIQVDPIDHSKPRYLHFLFTAGALLGDSEAQILIEVPGQHWMGKPYLELYRDDEELVPEEYIVPDEEYENAFVIQVPDFREGDVLQVSIGWYAAEYENYGAVFSLQTEALKRYLIGTWQGPHFVYERR